LSSRFLFFTGPSSTSGEATPSGLFVLEEGELLEVLLCRLCCRYA